MENKLACMIIVSLIALIILSYYRPQITGNAIIDEKIVIYFPKAADFSNDESSTIIFEFNYPGDAFKVGNRTAEMLMFLDSDIVPGLIIGYDTVDKVIIAGKPAMRSERVELMDGRPHKLAYTFHRKEERQAIVFDEKVIAEEKYDSSAKEQMIIAGYFAYKTWKRVDSNHALTVHVKSNSQLNS